mgnify:CR=1 FL=1
MTELGGCFCGAITYKISGNLRDARSCHCSRCRKAFSSQASAYALVNSDEFVWLTGEDLLTSFVGKQDFGDVAQLPRGITAAAGHVWKKGEKPATLAARAAAVGRRAPRCSAGGIDQILPSVALVVRHIRAIHRLGVDSRGRRSARAHSTALPLLSSLVRRPQNF